MNLKKEQTPMAASAKQQINQACEMIAPTWPLDQLIAVNPLWEMRKESYHQVAARLSMLANVDSFMPINFYQQRYAAGEISDSELNQAASQYHTGVDPAQLQFWLTTPAAQAPHFHSLAELFDCQRASDKMSWREEITHQISQFCAIHFQQQGSDVEQTKTTQSSDLYQHWLEVTCRDKGLSILLNEPGLNGFFAGLPAEAEDLLSLAVNELSLDDAYLLNYSQALLLEINGWASWVAYEKFQARLNQQTNENMQSLLAIKMAWELVVWWYHKRHKSSRFEQVKSQWQAQRLWLDSQLKQHHKQQIPSWVWQSALELSFQNKLQQKLLSHEQQQPEPDTTLQAAFCIDVRSEVMRRALEQQDDGIQTMGFAGFFGLPIYFQPTHMLFSRPQLPGLLKPTIKAEQCEDLETKSVTIRRQARWKNWSQSAPASFTVVESAGWWYAFKLLKQSLSSKTNEHPVNQLSHQKHWRLSQNGVELDTETKAELATSILNAMGLEKFAPWVLLIGHGSQSSNNLQAASLDCGACGGQTGEVNVRVLAELLNQNSVRAALLKAGIKIPQKTRFVAALHNTTTDEIECFDAQPDAHILSWLKQASNLSRQERLLKIAPEQSRKSPQQRHRTLIKRANDWSQVRPEWGLANNAAFIIAPRSWTRKLDLEGRCFLHDYTWQKDPGFAVLEMLLTAPMVVTHWINMQYNLSVTDNHKFGSGNKVLHNAVNGSMGVFEGNGGDLRIGLAKQSLHDGQQWMHTPQRLSVYTAAPKQAILDILNKHQDIYQLVNNDWLYLFCWHEGSIERVNLA